MIPGPLGVVLVAVLAVWISDAGGFWPFAAFAAVAGVCWLVLHPVLGAALRRVAHARLKGDGRLHLMEASQEAGLDRPLFRDEIFADLSRDPVWFAAFAGAFLLKWVTIVGVAWMVAL